MAKFAIAANMTNQGVYEAETKEAAILAYVKDAGYKTLADAADACNQTEDDFLDDIDCIEVSSEDAARFEI